MTLFVSLSLAQAAPTVPPPAGLLNVTWVDSSETVPVGELLYRPEGFAMPPSRSRTTWRFSSDGTMVKVGTGGSDTSLTVTCEWRMTAADRLEMRDKKPNAPWLRYQIVTLAKDKLLLKQN